MSDMDHCHYCAGIHPGVRCPAVKAIDYYPNGTIKRVEFVGPPPTLIGVAPAQPWDWNRPFPMPAHLMSTD